MRKYLDRQPTKSAYYKDRFYITPNTQKLDPNDKFGKELKAISDAGIDIIDSYIELENLVIIINANDNFKTLNILKSVDYEQLSDLSAVDFLSSNGTFRIFYQLLSYSKHSRVRVICNIKPKQKIKSVISLYKSANWSERECYDMFGIFFEGHPNLKRLLMPDDWYSHPLLKSYPLHGDEHARWYEVDKIFGKEYREIIGEENRDSAYSDDKDTFGFSKIGAETQKGDERPVEKYLQEYQEDDGVKLVKRIKRESSKIRENRP